MKKLITAVLVCTMFSSHAQFKLNKKTVSSGTKVAKALTFTNKDAIKLSADAVQWMDENNPVANDQDPYTIRLNRLFKSHKNEDGLALNYKVYLVKDINAFACADGSVRVFSSLMDILTDNELLAVIGHEVGHVKNEDTKKAIKSAYLTAAAMDATASQSGAVQTLSESQLGEFAQEFLGSSHSRKQESKADDYSYAFMKKNNYNVVGAYTAFKKLGLLSGSAKEQKTTEKMMNSHPDSNKRAETVKAKAEKDGLWNDPGSVTLPTEPIKQ